MRELTRVATATDEADLVALAEGTPAGRFRAALAAWRQRHEDDDDTERRHHDERTFSYRVDADGMVSGWFRLAPGDAAPLIAAVDAHVMRASVTYRGGDASAGASWPTLGQQRADALAALARGAGGRTVTEVVLHVRADGCSLDDGTPIAGSVVERIAPDSFVRALIHDAAGRPIDASSRRRHPTVRQRRVVRERDRACVDCGAGWITEYDHVPAFDVSRRTVVDELHLRCPPCHARRHRTAR